jgi:serine/threonine protein phosphatase PrpC
VTADLGRTLPDGAASVAQLLGSECTDVGGIHDVAVGDAAAIAMSIGRHPKVNPSVDPNEDAALVATGGGAALAVVADGHFGFDAARAAVTALRAEADVLLAQPPAIAEQALRMAVHVVEEAVLAALSDAGELAMSSRTALTVALIHAGVVHVSTTGDTMALLLTGRRLKPKGFRGDRRFIGPHHGPIEVARRRVQPGDRLVLASDGLTDYARSEAVAEIAAALAPPRETARRLVQLALDGGAGDNVTVVVVDPHAAVSGVGAG